MAKSQNKVSRHRAQPAHRAAIEEQHHISHLPQVKGKTLEDLEFISAPEYKGISLSFEDDTFLDFKIETSFTVRAEYLDQKTGKSCVFTPGEGGKDRRAS